MPVDILSEGTARKHPRVRRLRNLIRKRAESHFLALGLADPELSVVLTDNAHIQALNAQWREEDKPTDVLSFPLHEADEDFTVVDSLGDIVISVEYAETLVAEHGHRDRVALALDVAPDSLVWSLEEEIDFLLIHGLLHLVGHDHLEPDEEADMRSEERRLWGNGPS